MEMGLKNKVIVFTGAAGLIGRHCTQKLLKEQAKLVLVDSDQRSLKSLEEKMKLEHPNSETMFEYIDISDEKSLDRLITSCLNKFDRIDCLVNCAYPRTADWHFKFEDIVFGSWQRNVDMHLNSYFLISQKIAQQMMKQRSGNIINFSSIYGLIGPDFSLYAGLDSMTMPAAYAAIKGSISNLTRYMASYLGAYNIRVNALCPGGVKDQQPESFVKKYEEKTPLKRMATVEDIYGSLFFLISDLSQYVTGVNLPVDGGWTCV